MIRITKKTLAKTELSTNGNAQQTSIDLCFRERDAHSLGNVLSGRVSDRDSVAVKHVQKISLDEYRGLRFSRNLLLAIKYHRQGLTI